MEKIRTPKKEVVNVSTIGTPVVDSQKSASVATVASEGKRCDIDEKVVKDLIDKKDNSRLNDYLVMAGVSTNQVKGLNKTEEIANPNYVSPVSSPHPVVTKNTLTDAKAKTAADDGEVNAEGEAKDGGLLAKMGSWFSAVLDSPALVGITAPAPSVPPPSETPMPSTITPQSSKKSTSEVTKTKIANEPQKKDKDIVPVVVTEQSTGSESVAASTSISSSSTMESSASTTCLQAGRENINGLQVQGSVTVKDKLDIVLEGRYVTTDPP